MVKILPPSSRTYQNPQARTPRINFYEAARRDYGARSQQHMDPAPAPDTSIARGLAALAGGVGDVTRVIEAQEKEKQTLDAMANIQAFQDRERDMFARMDQMKGSLGFDAPGFVTSFYDQEGQALKSQAKGDFQKMYYENFLAGTRDSGLNRAFGHRTRELENYKNQLYHGTLDRTLADAATNPAGWRDAAAGQKARFAELNPGAPEEFLEANYRSIDAASLESALTSRLDQGDIQGAQELLNGWRGGSTGKYVEPVPGMLGLVSSHFGHRTQPKAGASTDHKGIDVSVPVGTPIKAMADGKVVAIRDQGEKIGYGKYMVVDYGDGTTSLVAHLSQYGQGLKVGDTVRQGDVIALSGNSGNSTGPHAHVEVRQNGAHVDPEKFFRGASADPKLAMALQRKIDQQKALYERSAEDGAKALKNDLGLHVAGVAMNGVGVRDYEENFKAAEARGGITPEEAETARAQITAAHTVYEAINSPEGRFKNFAEARAAVDKDLNPGELEGEITRGYAAKAEAHRAAVEMVDEQEKLFRQQPLDYVAKTAQTEYETMAKEGLVPEGREAVTQIEVARRIAAEKGGLTTMEIRQLPALTSGQASAFNRAWTEASDADKKVMIADMEKTYGPYFSRVLADAKIGAGAITYMTVADDTADGRLIRELSLMVDGKKLSDYKVPKEDKDRVSARLATLFDEDGPLGVLAEINRQRGDQTVADEMSGLRENLTKIAYEMVDRGIDADSALKKIGQGFGAGYRTIKDPDLALISFPADRDSGAMVRGINAIKEAMGAAWDDGFFFRNADDGGVALDTPDGVTAYLTFDQIEKVGGASTQLDPDPWQRSAWSVKTGNPHASGTGDQGRKKSLNYSPYAAEVDAGEARKAAQARAARAKEVVSGLKTADYGPSKAVLARGRTVERLKGGTAAPPSAVEVPTEMAMWAGDPSTEGDE